MSVLTRHRGTPVRGAAAPVAVTHFGNRAGGEGGIATVIRQHLRSDQGPVRASAVTTYDQGAPTRFGRQRPAVGAMRRAALLPRSGTVAHVHLSRRSSFVREGSVLVLLRLRRVHVVVTLHGSTLTAMTGLPLAAIRLLLRVPDRVHGFDERYRLRFRVPEQRWVTIPNSVDMPPVSLRKRPVVVFAGRVGRRKGADVLMTAWHDMPEPSELHVFGGFDDDAPEPASGVPDLVVHGPAPHATVLEALDEASILVQPSRAEAFPMAVCEALAAGCAVIGTDVGALGALLRDAGQIVVPLDADALRTAMVDLLESPPHLAERGASARAYAAAHLASDVVAFRWAEVYRALALLEGTR